MKKNYNNRLAIITNYEDKIAKNGNGYRLYTCNLVAKGKPSPKALHFTVFDTEKIFFKIGQEIMMTKDGNYYVPSRLASMR